MSRDSASAAGRCSVIRKPILFPLIHFYTNEEWAVLRGIASQAGVPLLLMDHYGKGELYVLAVPEEMNDLYALPAPVLNALRRYLTPDLPVRLEGPSQVSLFEYDNGTFVVESYRDQPAAVRVIGSFAHLTNLTTGTAADGEPIAGQQQYGYELQVEPHSIVGFREGKSAN